VPSGRGLDALLIAALIAAVASVYSVYAIRVGSFQADEGLYMGFAHFISAHFPRGIWAGPAVFPRGVQRLAPLLMSVGFAVSGRGPATFEIDHVILCVLFASTALPVFLLARGSALGRGASLFAAVLATVVPWAVVSTSFLTESVAYPAYAWVLWASWRLIREPRRSRELILFATLLVAALSRTALLALAAVPPLAVLWHEWSWGLREEPRSARLRRLPRRVLDRYPLLSAAVLLGLVIFVANAVGALPGRGLDAVVGEYGLPHFERLSTMLARFRVYLSRITAGTGFLAAAIGLPWALAQLARPRDGRRHALAVVSVLGVGAILLSLLKGGPDERYVLYGAVPFALCAAGALSAVARLRARPRPSAAVGTLAGGVLVALLIDSVVWPGLANGYDFFTYPAGIFYARALLSHIGKARIPLADLSATHLVGAWILIVLVLWVLSWQLSRTRLIGTLLLGVALLGYCGEETYYAFHKYATGAGESTRSTASERSWVDRHVPGGAQVGRLLISEGAISNYASIWHAVDFWNLSITSDLYAAPPDPLPLYLEDIPLRYSTGATGELSFTASDGVTPAPAPRYFLEPTQGTNTTAVVARVIGADPYVPLTLIEPSRPIRLYWGISGLTPEAFATSDAPVIATIYKPSFEPVASVCASFELIAAPHFTGSWPFTVTLAGHTLRRGSILSQQTLSETVRLPRFSGQPEKLVTVIHGGAPYGAQTLSARFANLAVGPCPAPAG
jgi:hypothetical protein